MGARIDLVGRRFGMLVVESEAEPAYIGKARQRQIRWNCICDCGNHTVASSILLRSGGKQSCGCSTAVFISAAKRRDITGQKFGRLTVLPVPPRLAKGKHLIWSCQCECGNIIEASTSNLTCGNTKSCGCYRAEVVSTSKKTHGCSDDRLYAVWSGMKERCNNPNHISYIWYGGRGITVCDEWQHSFIAFKEWAENHGYDTNAPRGECTIDRIDVNGQYCPENCRFVPMSSQNTNRRSDL